jgi:DNA gyrase subunit A
MMITNEGIIIRMFVDDISILKRVTLGVKLMNTGINNDIVVASITKVKESVTEADAEEAQLQNEKKDIEELENFSETE